MRILNPAAPRGQVAFALFDFDGTLSRLRRGWETVMQRYMEEVITSGSALDVQSVRAEITTYIDESTGILTIHQMRWLTAAFRRLRPGSEPLGAHEHKRRYNARMAQLVKARLHGLRAQQIVEQYTVAGASEFLATLDRKDVVLYLASGTDDVYVQEEAAILGVCCPFHGRVYGARDDTEEYTKENIIRRILTGLSDSSEQTMVVFGDGPVEIRAAKDFGAIAVGLATDEEQGHGWNEHKVRRLARAGADVLIPDFRGGTGVLEFIERGA